MHIVTIVIYQGRKVDFVLLDVVALTDDLPEHGLLRGQVGTVVKALVPGGF